MVGLIVNFIIIAITVAVDAVLNPDENKGGEKWEANGWSEGAESPSETN